MLHAGAERAKGTSFMVRMWLTEQGTGQESVWLGELLIVRDDTRYHFTGLEGLTSLVEHILAEEKGVREKPG